MNVLFLCMGNMLEVYYNVSQLLKEQNKSLNFFYYISDLKNFKKFKNKYPNFENENYFFSEWSLTNINEKDNIDFENLKEVENKYFNNSPILEPFSSDRRIYLGPNSKFFQDYRSSYQHEEILKILLKSTKIIEDFIELNNIKVVIGFTTATYAEIIISKVCQKKKINFFHLRHTKIGKNYTFSRDLYEFYHDIRYTYKNQKHINYDDDNVNEIINKLSNQGIEYEGRVGHNLSIIDLLIKLPYEFFSSIYNYFNYSNIKKDNHYKINFIKIYYFDRVKRVLNSKLQLLFLKNRFKKMKDLSNNFEYAFFPLHAEPEISISIFSSFYENQIEVIRNISRNLPANFKLLVKEHPRNIGRRKNGYYKKIALIPNVILVFPFENSRKVILKSRIVIVLSGFIAFEALMLKKPVISLGNAIYNMLPKTLINYVDNIQNIFSEIKFSLDNFKYDQKIIYRYLNAILKNSSQLDLYTVLLKKKGRGGGEVFSEDLFEKNIKNITEMVLKKLNENL